MPSMVWTCFTKTEAGPKCILCKDLRKRRDSSTKTMWVHLKLKHFEIYQYLRGASENSSKPTLKKSEGSSNVNEMAPQLFQQYNNLIMFNYLNILCSNQAGSLQQSTPNPLFFQMYFRLLASGVGNCCATSSQLEETKYDQASHWPEAGQNYNCNTNMTCKK